MELYLKAITCKNFMLSYIDKLNVKTWVLLVLHNIIIVVSDNLILPQF